MTSTIPTSAKKMPFVQVYEGGIIESVANFFTIMFRIEPFRMPKEELLKHKLTQLYLHIPKDTIFQMVLHNAWMEKEDYLRSVLVPQEQLPQAVIYNKTLLEHIDIGCNNVQKHLYFVIGCKAPSLEKAKDYLQEQYTIIEKAFGDIPLQKLDSLERLEILYRIFHPKKNNFRNILDLKNDGMICLENLKYLKLTEQELIAPKYWDTSTKLVNYTILEKEQETQIFSRTLFLNNIPRELSSNIISDLTSVSSNMLFSIQYHCVDATLGYEEATELVKKNTFLIKKQKRETIQDKKNHTVLTFSERKLVNEDVYQSEAALETTKNIVASNETWMEVSISITLFADTLEELNKSTDMLRISATKFACSVKTLDLLQYKGFCSSLPLCKSRVNVSRFLDTKHLVPLSPIYAIEKKKRGGAFYGLNAINDTLIFYNRTQGVNLTGILIGMEYSGKTYQMKREILNALVTTKDTIHIISFGEEYDAFVTSLHGSSSYLQQLNPFAFLEGYGLTEDDIVAKRIFLSAFIKEETEVEQLLKHSEQFNDRNYMFSIIENEKYPKLKASLSSISPDIVGETNETHRLHLYKVQTKEDLLVTMEYLWNQSIAEKKKNHTNWIFIDNIDVLITHPTSLAYLLRFIKDSSAIRNIVTMVLQDMIGLIVSSISHSIAVEDVITSCGYIKLLNQGPIERKKLVELLNIPNALIPYITNVEPSQGLMITLTSMIAFNDNFLERGHEFTKLFQ